MSDDNAAEWLFIAFVRGADRRCRTALYNLKRICANYLDAPYRIEVVDLNVQPDRGRQEDVIALPTVIRRRPLPETRIIGDLSNTSSVLRAINIPSEEDAKGEWTANIAEQVKMLHYSIIRLTESFLSMFSDPERQVEQQERVFASILRSAVRHVDFERNLRTIRGTALDTSQTTEVEEFRRRIEEYRTLIGAGSATRVEAVEFIRNWFLKRFREPG